MARRLIVLAVAVSLSVSLSAPIQATAEPLAPGQPTLTQPAAVAAATSALGEWATRTYGVRFGGLWLSSTASTAHVVVGVVAPTASDQTRLSQTSASLKEASEMVAVSRSLSNLALESKAIYQFALLRHPAGPVMVGVETQRNQVRVEGGQSDAALIGQIVQSFGADVVDANVVQGSLTASVADSRTTFPPYKAGREVATFMPKSGEQCTSGFDMIITVGPGTGLDQGSMSGHCAYSNYETYIYPTGQPVGVTNLSTFFTTNPVICDCQLIGFNNQSVHTNKMYVSSTVTDSVVTEVANVYQGQNVALCKSASTTGVTCGNVTFAPPVEVLGVPATDPVTGQSITRDIENLACGTLTVGPGDSGGPVYQTGYGQTAVGAAGLVSLQIGGSSSTKSCWATMDEVQLADGTRVRTS
jgi:hypothetical protein